MIVSRVNRDNRSNHWRTFVLVRHSHSNGTANAMPLRSEAG